MVIGSNIIICGYPCMGKTTAATTPAGYDVIDLDSGRFKETLKNREDWVAHYILHARSILAMHSKRPGYDDPAKCAVMVSSHPVVRDEIRSSLTEILTPCYYVFPTLSSKELVLKAAKERYEKDPTEGNKRAYDFMVQGYDDSIFDAYIEIVKADPNKTQVNKIMSIPVDMTKGYYMTEVIRYLMTTEPEDVYMFRFSSPAQFNEEYQKLYAEFYERVTGDY